MSPCSPRGGEAVALQRAGERRHVALAVAEDDRVLEVSSARISWRERGALLLGLAGDRDQALLDGLDDRVLAGDLDASPGRAGSGSVRRWISGGMVAEKNRVWRRGGSRPQMRSMSGMKPMSSMRSASSMTRISTPVSRMRPRSNWSSMRPGVAISTSAPRSRTLFWSSKRDAADQQRHVELVVLAVLLEVLGDLRGQFARRLEDQRARHARAGAAAFEQCRAWAARRRRSCRCPSGRCR